MGCSSALAFSWIILEVNEMKNTHIDNSFSRLKVALQEEFKSHNLGGFKLYKGNTWPSWSNYYPDAYAALIPDSPDKLFDFITPLTEHQEKVSFYELIDSFGFCCVAFRIDLFLLFPRDDYSFESTSGKKYKELLDDQRWKDRANLVRQMASNECQDCGKVQDKLDVHHCYYMPMHKNFAPWEYPLHSLRALCRKCHVSRAAIELDFRAWMSNKTQHEISSLLNDLKKNDLSRI